MTIVQSIRAHGALKTALLAARHARFVVREYLDAEIDRRLGVETTGRVPVSELCTAGAAWEQASPYQAITRRYFSRMMAAAPFGAEGAAFVDLGAGKGRALIYAAEHPFAEIIGVELSPELHRIAAHNMERVVARMKPVGRVSLWCMDAREVQLPARDLYLFLYNPFGPAVMQGVLDNLERWHARSDKRLVVLYRTPSCAELFERAAFLEPVVVNSDFHVYAGRDRSQPLEARVQGAKSHGVRAAG